MEAFDKVLSLDELKIFWLESNVVVDVIYFPSKVYEPMILGPISLMTQ